MTKAGRGLVTMTALAVIAACSDGASLTVGSRWPEQLPLSRHTPDQASGSAPYRLVWAFDEAHCFSCTSFAPVVRRMSRTWGDSLDVVLLPVGVSAGFVDTLIRTRRLRATVRHVDARTARAAGVVVPRLYLVKGTKVIACRAPSHAGERIEHTTGGPDSPPESCT